MPRPKKEPVEQSPLIQALNELRRMTGQGKYYDLVPSSKQLDIISCLAAEIGCFFGNRAGKTWTIGMILCQLACGIWSPRGQELKTEYNVWISSQSAEKNASVILPMILRIVPTAWLKWKLKDSMFIINGPAAVFNIRLKSVEQGAPKFAGDDIDLIFLDEPHPRDIYNECLIRIISCKGVIISTMTAVGRYVDWQPEYFKDKALFFADSESNPWIDIEEIERNMSGMTDIERKVRRTGHFVDMAGARFLDDLEMEWLKTQIRKPVASLSVNIEYSADSPLHVYLGGGPGEIQIYEDEIDPEGIYVAGLDISTGSGQDYTCLKIGRLEWRGRLICREVLCFASKTTKIPVISAVAAHICSKYGDAMLNLDRSGIGDAVLQEMVMQHGYGTFAGRQNFDAITITDTWGFKFSAESRKYLHQEFRIAVSNRMLEARDETLRSECKEYRFDVNAGRYDHPLTGHDDHITACGLMWLSAKQLEHVVERIAPKIVTDRQPGQMTFDEFDAGAEWYEKNVGVENG